MAIEGYGALLEVDNGGLGVYSPITEVIKIGLPGIEVTEIDVTHLQSPAKWKEFLPGFMNAGEVTFTLLFDGSQYAGIFALLNIVASFRLTLSDSSVWVCSGFFSKLGGDVPLDDKVTNEVTVKLTGEPSFTG